MCLRVRFGSAHSAGISTSRERSTALLAETLFPGSSRQETVPGYPLILRVPTKSPLARMAKGESDFGKGNRCGNRWGFASGGIKHESKCRHPRADRLLRTKSIDPQLMMFKQEFSHSTLREPEYAGMFGGMCPLSDQRALLRANLNPSLFSESTDKQGSSS